eukprot:Skav221209  [mRNA]  locus=scaffold2467:118558:119648:+ [translate_table: standard]
MVEGEVFVFKLFTVDGLAPSPIAFREVTTLAHELRNYPMELGTFVAESFLSAAQRPEILQFLEPGPPSAPLRSFQQVYHLQ